MADTGFGLRCDGPISFETRGFAETVAMEVRMRGSLEARIAAPPATIKIIIESINKRGRSRSLLPDQTVLVGSSRQPFLDAARVLVAAGYEPDGWLEGWQTGATAFALRAQLGIAAGLTIDETRTIFAPWKPFSPSAVSPSIRHSEIPATTQADARWALLASPDRCFSNEGVERNHSAPPR